MPRLKIWDDNTSAWVYLDLPGVNAAAYPIDGRLTLTSGLPITSANVNGATSIFYTPYVGDKIALYDGVSAWNVRTFTELTLNIAGYTASKNYDIFIYDNAGTPTIESLVWTNDTTRATALTTQNGVLVKSGATTRRYIGTIRINSSGGQTDDSAAKRFVWNYYHRVQRIFYRYDATQHTYNSVTAQYWNNDSTMIVEFVCGIQENALNMGLGILLKTDIAADLVKARIGLDGTTGPIFGAIIQTGITDRATYSNAISIAPELGYHFFSIVELTTATATGTYYATILTGTIMA